ncbi:50S ribosomal protein L25/general stress protein Ctc [Glacieibacterium frigidum]|uniref:Large ribosomal subunit protein bL25 n=1 Tax=Glacieibacterium frigidum TaxID=2593303 RepID=A0A552U747_9SPHN|nr:50S ribosomal protein L25/general stress protein Ctc [Glacieibacterium frigidum]TRW14038.1 50S ribosomal protein L25/general stress protein Ctc [Glacieibacterium frigidum]
MSEAMKLAAGLRERAGKGASRAVRLTGRVPAVIYGDKQAPVTIHVPEKELTKLLHTGHFMNSVVELELDGATHRTLPRDVQFHVVSDRPIHVDFLRLAIGGTIAVQVPVHFTDEDQSPGMKRGGTLNIVRHEVELNCPSDAIPDQLNFSLAGLDIGDSIHISAITLPEKVTPVITDRDFTIATVVAPSALQSADAAADEETAAAAAAESAAEAEAKSE